MNVRYHAYKILVPILLGFALQGCGGDEEEAVAASVADPDPEIDVIVNGSVGDGPVANAQIAVLTSTGTLLQNVVSSQLAGYNVSLKTKGKYFPLLIEATGGTDLVTNLPPDFRLRSSAPTPSNRSTANVNPFTTLALATAEQMDGGLTATNIRTALGTTTAKFNSGLTTLAAGGVMDATIDNSNLPEIVMSSETLAEIFRRVHSIRRASGRASSVDEVFRVVGADLIDGKLDGRGTAQTDTHASAATALVSAQVLVEAMTNSLRVNGQPATAALDNAINRLASSPLTTPTASLPITAGMIDAARVGTAAAIAIVPSPALTTLQQRLGALTPGMLPAAVVQALPSGASAALAPALTQITAGAASDVAAVNTISGGSPGPSNQPPTISGTPPTTVTVGTAYSFTLTASDPDSGTLTFAIANRPAWASFNTTTGQLTGTPSAANVGAFANIAISVSDGTASASLPAFSITVNAAPNRAPTISGTPPTTVTVGTTYSFTPSASDPDGGAVTFAIANRPSWATFNATTGQLAGTPSAANVGAFANIVISVSDGTDSVSLPPFTITVNAAPNRAPTISGAPPPTVTVGTAYSFMPTASDPDGGTLTFTIANRPAWATFNTTTGRLTGTPSAANVGTFASIGISVSDGTANVSLPVFAITVNAAPNQAPTISGTPATSVLQGTLYSFRPTATDVDGSTLTFAIANRPSWATFNTTTGQLAGTPAAANVGTFANIVISVSDGTDSVSLPAFSITVNAPPNQAPTISGTPGTAATVGTAYSFTPTASDPDGGTLTFSIVNRPSWATFTTATGRLTGTPAAANVGTFANIVISVSDGTASVSLPAFSVTVNAPPNQPPTISGTPPTTVTVGTAYSFAPTASDPDGGTLTFSIVNRPSWATFNGATGRLTGTPAAANVGTFTNIAISVSDGTASVALPAFTITVNALPNQAPTISGIPGTTATVGTAYSFTPTASDPDGGTLTFSIVNRPSWATFTAATGRLTGTPAAANVGTFASIVISVSDGSASIALPAFAITVSPAPNRAPTISGTPATSVLQGTLYSFQPTAADADGDTLTFSVTNKPAWATFDAATGRLQGTPGPGDVGTTTGIVIHVSDGAASASLASFNLSVQAVAAGSATLTWQLPTTNTDGSPLTNLAGFKVYWGTAPGDYTSSVTIMNPGLATYVVGSLTPNTYHFAVAAINSAGAESTFSNPGSKTIP